MSDRTTPASSNDMILGELRGKMGELVHSVNNLMHKVDILGDKVTALGGVSRDLAEVRVIVSHHEKALGTAVAAAKEIEELKAEVAALKDERSRRDGASSMIGSVLKWPPLGWLIAALATAYVTLTGRTEL